MDTPTNGERPVTQKELIKLQLDWTEKLFEKTAELHQDLTELKESIVRLETARQVENSQQERTHSRRAEVIWTLGSAIAFAALIVSLVR